MPPLPPLFSKGRESMHMLLNMKQMYLYFDLFHNIYTFMHIFKKNNLEVCLLHNSECCKCVCSEEQTVENLIE